MKKEDIYFDPNGPNSGGNYKRNFRLNHLAKPRTNKHSAQFHSVSDIDVSETENGKIENSTQ